MIRAAAACLFLAACTTTPPALHGETLTSIRALDQRVAAIGWRLATANAELCPERKPLTGFTLHEAGQYGGASRSEAVRLFGIADAPAIQTIAAGSPAEAAKLRIDDHIIAADGVDLRNPAPGAEPSYGHLIEVAKRIDAAAADGEILLAVRRGGEPMQVVLRPLTGCAYLMQVRPSAEINAWADGRSITLSSGFVRFAERDEELALMMGHELAHNILRHPLAPSRTREREADRVGAYLAARAGYDISAAAGLWRRFGEVHWRARLGVGVHPGASARLKALAEVVEEIEARRAAGAPLVP